MKAIDDITRTAVDAIFDGFNFGYDPRPIRKGEMGAGILVNSDDAGKCLDEIRGGTCDHGFLCSDNL
ncbi:hypothetical protein ACFCZT_40415 [Streptomyces sp. NPDC056230]|uniref:hypothetical protein n=1 Tax=Streptomyces sp. NPDC056230 TaxID=3345754 RepID=UPI0035E3AF12